MRCWNTQVQSFREGSSPEGVKLPAATAGGHSVEKIPFIFPSYSSGSA